MPTTTKDVLRKIDDLAGLVGDNPQAQQLVDELREDIIGLGGSGGEQAAAQR